ncbi:aldo/keto reductase [Algibacter sp. PT7-4]|uniref:aldo/keto reductase n=1 Tax=Algibacter ulvanivorans TaxID=3400999 RepID=UPI003AABE743
MNLKTKIGLGLAALGRPEYINIRAEKLNDKSEGAFKLNTFSVLDEAYKLGVRYFDTAPSYGKGEAFLNEWNLKNNDENIVLGTKWGYTYVANWELGFKGKHEIKEHSLEKLKAQWEISKQLLPNLKYYQVHSATLESGILDNKVVLNQLYQIKKEIGLQIGISTSGTNQSEVINLASKITVNNEYLFDSFQVTYNVLEQSTFKILKHILSQGKKVIIKEALANGRIFSNKKFHQYQQLYLILKELAKKYEVGIDAIALRFVIDSLEPTYVLSGASNISQLQENLKALHFNLSIKEINRLKSLHNLSSGYWQERSNLLWN